MFDMLIRGATLVTENGQQVLDLALSNERIAALLTPGTSAQAHHEIAANDKYVLPGVIDIHFHIRAPAYPHRGTVFSETRAAMAGGITTIFEMPISQPCCSTPAVVRQRRAHFEKEAFINFGLYGALGTLTPEHVLAMVDEGIIGFKIFMTESPKGRENEFLGLNFPDESSQYEALELVSRTGLVTAVHAESDNLVKHFTSKAKNLKRNNPRIHGESRPSVTESVAIAKLLTMNREINASLHISHVTSRAGVDVLRLFKKDGMDVSGETCPHYLLFTEEVLSQVGTFAKINPPIRNKHDQEALWVAVKDGTLSMITTDHSPLTYEEKERAKDDMLVAPPGAPGAEVLLLSMLDAVHKGYLTLEQTVNLVSTNSAKRFGLYPSKGTIRPGADADLVLVDFNSKTTIIKDNLLTQAKLCGHLYDGITFNAAIDSTILAGKIVYQQGQILGQAGDGRYVVPQMTPIL